MVGVGGCKLPLRDSLDLPYMVLLPPVISEENEINTKEAWKCGAVGNNSEFEKNSQTLLLLLPWCVDTRFISVDGKFPFWSPAHSFSWHHFLWSKLEVEIQLNSDVWIQPVWKVKVLMRPFWPVAALCLLLHLTTACKEIKLKFDLQRMVERELNKTPNNLSWSSCLVPRHGEEDLCRHPAHHKGDGNQHHPRAWREGESGFYSYFELRILPLERLSPALVIWTLS